MKKLIMTIIMMMIIGYHDNIDNDNDYDYRNDNPIYFL